VRVSSRHRRCRRESYLEARQRAKDNAIHLVFSRTRKSRQQAHRV
jgi:hypothetical protein